MSHPIANVEQGQLKGKTCTDYLGGNYIAFQGIPYAKPPVGDLRFKAPVPAEPWTGIRDATKEGPESVSPHLFFQFIVGSEKDCLNLSVYTRELPKGENPKLKPVMVWIHGGGFLMGSNKTELFGPEYLMTEDIVLVSINYRLGVLGFLSLENTSLGIPGNAGLKDQVLALKWVQKNIHNFNGDPSNVTIFGESAGGASVHYLLVSPMAKGLFHKAICQSGCSINPWARGKANSAEIAKLLGLKDNDEAKILEELRKLPAEKIIKAQKKYPDPFKPKLIRPFGPVVEKPSSEPAFLLEDPISTLRSGTFNKVPVMMGYMSCEGILGEIVRRYFSKESGDKIDFENELPYNLGFEHGSTESKELAEKLRKFYYKDQQPTEKNIQNALYLRSDTQFVHGIHRCIDHQKRSTPHPIYLYKMTLESSLNLYKQTCSAKYIPLTFGLYYLCYSLNDGVVKNNIIKMIRNLPQNDYEGVCHADDCTYLFKSFLSPVIRPGSDEDTYIRRFLKLWTNFATFGNPTPVEDELLNKATWKPIEGDDYNYLEIDKILKSRVNPENETERCKFWNTIYGSKL